MLVHIWGSIVKQFLIGLVAVIIVACSNPDRNAGSANSDDVTSKILGTWRVTSVETIRASTREPISSWLGPDPTGTIVYLPNGYMAVQLMRDPPPEYSAESFEGATREEMADAFLGYYAYYGGYTVDEARSSVTHHIESSLLPEERGVSKERFFELDGDRLSLETSPFTEEGELRINRLVWERM
jgi:hypothetical protein